MTVLISGNLIQDQIRGISDELLRRGNAVLDDNRDCDGSVLPGSASFRMKRRSSHLLERKENARELSKRAEKSENELGVYKVIANKDSLTGVQSKYAYHGPLQTPDD